MIAADTPAGRVLHEDWTLEGSGWFSAEQLERSGLANGRGHIAGFDVVASHHT